ncbi:MAG TPA: Rrf2 family transcriptional regulator [Candidatus Kapabacteria bacterium]|nr:Rrf2 family transcriptional regulator [Candidatus Kapabacteria bacterium]
MFKMSRQADYALQFLTELARLPDGEFLSIRTFATKSTISFLFLQRIAAALRHAGIVSAVKGAAGGYYLARPIQNITVKDVIEAVDGPFGMVACQTPGKTCSKEGVCTTKETMKQLNDQISTLLSHTSIRTFIRS